MGFVAASIGGIIYLNVLRKKGRFKGSLGAEVSEAEDRQEAVMGKNEIPLSESLDKLTVQVALVFGGYIMAYLIMIGINAVIGIINALNGKAKELPLIGKIRLFK